MLIYMKIVGQHIAKLLLANRDSVRTICPDNSLICIVQLSGQFEKKIQIKSGNFETNSILYLKINNSEVFNLFSFDSVVQVKRSCYFTLIQSTINTFIRIKQCSSRPTAP